MKFLVLLIFLLHAVLAEAQEFVCGFVPVPESEGAKGASSPKATQGTGTVAARPDDAYFRSRIIRPLFVFGKFKEQPDPADLNALLDREGVANQSAGALLTATYKGSLAHYFSQMSKGALTLIPPSTGIDKTWYESTSTSIKNYVGETCKYVADNGTVHSSYSEGVGKFMQEVLAKVDARIGGDFSQYDLNMDGLIDVVGLFIPPEFQEACGKIGTAFEGNDNDPKYIDADGNIVATQFIISSVTYSSKTEGTLPPSFPFMVGVLAHEYGHLMGLPELYDTTPLDYNGDGEIDDEDYPYHSVGIGRWGVMGRGPLGWLHKLPDSITFDGPTSMSAWSRMYVEWITPETVEKDLLGDQIHDINSSEGKVLRVPVLGSDKEYFLVSNRQKESYYDNYAPASGLAIWHVDEGVRGANNNELHKLVDLECADGLFSDKGYDPDNIPNSPNSVSGGDNLDYLSAPQYSQAHNGNFGDATDLWDGETYTAFTPYTNPSTAGYAVFPDPNDPKKELTEQRVCTGIAVHNIQALPNGVMQADIYRNYWSGPITEDTVWDIFGGRIIVGGDVTIRSGVTLTIKPGVEVRFIANSDDTGSGNDNVLSEVIVEDGGRLIAGEQLETGSNFFPVTFRSSTNDPLPLEWYGFHVESGGRATLTDVTVRDGVHCVQADPGGSLVLENLTLINCGTPPTIEGNPTPEFPEDSTEPVAAYTAEDAEGDAVAWSLGTAAAEAAFTLTSEGVLDFEEPPDFETLNGDSLFSVTVRATDRQQAFTDYPVTVTVRNVDEAGTVVLSPLPPEVDGELTATLADVDGVVPETTAWTWEADGHSVHTDSGGETSRYTPSLSDVGQVLQVRVDYADGHGPNKSAESAPTAAVVGPELVGPDAPTFVENGEEAVAEYEVSGVDGPVTWSLDGTDAAAFALAAASSQASLSFSSPPNYEDPTDTDLGGTNTYHVTVVATLTDGAAAAENSLADMMAAFAALSDDSPSAQASSSALTKAVVVTVEDGDDPGVVSLPPGPPRVGTPLTAVLEEEDELLPNTTAWTWESVESTDGPGPVVSTGSAHYTPTGADVGRLLLARVSYEDEFGPKEVVSAPTAAVLPAGEVSLTPAEPRVGQPLTARLSGPEEAVTGAACICIECRQQSRSWAEK